MIFKRRKIGMALGGGGVRSVSSLGVIKNLKREGVKVSYLSGTSMGAIVGALYAYYLDAERVKGAFNRMIESENYKAMSDEFSKKLGAFSGHASRDDGFRVKFKKYFSMMSLISSLKNNISLIGSSTLRPVIDELIPDIKIEELKLPFCCIAADMKSGKKVVFKKGSLRKAIMATVAIPGIIEPVNYKNMFLADGMVTSLTPAEEVRLMGATYVIAVEVMPRLRKERAFSSGLDIMERANTITARKLHSHILKEADLVISPPVKNIYWANFDKIDYCIKAGESATFDIKSRIR